MSDLSWFNPTPHAIAVYASRPLSPVAAQHSLPSGRYSLLGPDFHRLDRTSLRLAHSFDHLIGAQQDCRRQIDTDGRSGLQIHHHLELGGLLDRQIGGLGAASDPINELGNTPEQRRDARAVAQQATSIYPFAEDKHGQNPMPKSKIREARAIAKKRRRCWDYEHASMIGGCLLECGLIVIRRLA